MQKLSEVLLPWVKSSTTYAVAECKQDRRDSYHLVKWIVLPVLLVYALVALTNSHSVERIETHQAHTSSIDGPSSQPMHRSVARDSLLIMTVHTPFPSYLLNAHSYAGLALFILVFVQKEVVARMGMNYATYVSTHRIIGYSIMGLMVIMDAAGWLMGFYPAYSGFQFFSVLFAAPWLVLLVGIYLTASRMRARLHRVFGNLIVKACIAVPLARIAGAFLQRNGWEEETGYYTGIAAVTAVIGAWAIFDVIKLIRLNMTPN